MFGEAERGFQRQEGSELQGLPGGILPGAFFLIELQRFRTELCPFSWSPVFKFLVFVALPFGDSETAT